MAQPTPEELNFAVPELVFATGYAAKNRADRGEPAAILHPSGKVEGRSEVLKAPPHELGSAVVEMILQEFPRVPEASDKPADQETQDVYRRVHSFLYGDGDRQGFVGLSFERREMVGKLACRVIWAMPPEMFELSGRPATTFRRDRQTGELSLNVITRPQSRQNATPSHTEQTIKLLHGMGKSEPEVFSSESEVAHDETVPLRAIESKSQVKDTSTREFPALGLSTGKVETAQPTQVLEGRVEASSGLEAAQLDLIDILEGITSEGNNIELSTTSLGKLAAKVIRMVNQTDIDQTHRGRPDPELSESLYRLGSFLDGVGRSRARKWVARLLSGDSRRNPDGRKVKSINLSSRKAQVKFEKIPGSWWRLRRTRWHLKAFVPQNTDPYSEQPTGVMDRHAMNDEDLVSSDYVRELALPNIRSIQGDSESEPQQDSGLRIPPYIQGMHNYGPDSHRPSRPRPFPMPGHPVPIRGRHPYLPTGERGSVPSRDHANKGRNYGDKLLVSQYRRAG